MGGFFAGLAGSIGDHLHEQHLINIQNQIETKRNLLDNYKNLLQDPHLEDVHGDIVQAMLQAGGTEPGKIQKLLKPGGNLDPTQWQVLAQQRASGQVASPVNQGQNPTQIPAAPPGHEGAPGGQAQQAPSWSDSTGGQQMGGGSGAGQLPTAPPPPPIAQAAGSSAAQSVQALPPVQGGTGAPDAATVVGPQQASAMTPPPPPVQYGPMGSLPQSELMRRQVGYQTQLDEAKNQAEFRRESAIGRQKTDEDLRAKRGHIQLIEQLQKEHPDWPMPMVLSAATGASMAGMGSLSRPVKLGSLVPSGSVPPEQLLNQYDQPIDPKIYPHVQSYRDPMTGKTYYEPTEIRADFTPHFNSNGQGGVDVNRGADLHSGAVSQGVTVPGAVAPSMLRTERTSSSTTDASGHTTSSSSSRKVAPAPPSGSPSPGGPATRAFGGAVPPPPTSITARPEIQRYAEDIRDGKNPTIPPKDRDAVTRYMVAHDIATPTALSARGSGDLAGIDPVLTEVQDLMKRLRDENLHTNNNVTTLVPDYAKYRMGVNTPHSDLFTNLSFERLRSAAAAMKGTNSRAYQVLQKALDHTPNMDRAGGLIPDSPKAIYGKLAEMEKLLRQGRNTILADEKKSGIPEGTSGGNEPKVQKWGRDASGNPVPLP